MNKEQIANKAEDLAQDILDVFDYDSNTDTFNFLLEEEDELLNEVYNFLIEVKNFLK